MLSTCDGQQGLGGTLSRLWAIVLLSFRVLGASTFLALTGSRLVTLLSTGFERATVKMQSRLGRRVREEIHSPPSNVVLGERASCGFVSGSKNKLGVGLKRGQF